MFLLVASTVITREPTVAAKYNLGLFWSYAVAFGVHKNQILANIVMFMPVGALLWTYGKKRYLLFGAAFSVIIEVTQLLTRRGMFELDDIFHNVLGLIIGWFAAKWIRILLKKAEEVTVKAFKSFWF